MTITLRRGLLWLAVVLLPTVVVAQTGPTGTLSANGAVGISTTGMGTASITIEGTYSGTIQFEVAGVAGTAVVTVDCATPGDPSTPINSTTSTGTWICPVASLGYLQVRMESYVSGTARVYLRASPGGGGTGGSATITGDVTVGDVGITSIAAGDNNIGNVDILSSALPTGASTSAKQDTVIGHVDGIEGLLAGTLTIAGTVTANLSATDNAVLDDIADGIAVTGTVTANLSATDNAVLDSIVLGTDIILSSKTPVAPGSATATTGLLFGGQYNLTPPTFTDGQQGSLQLTSAGALMVSGGGGGTEYVVNAAAPANATGNAPVVERDDALSALSEVEGDWTNLRSNANGALWVAIDGTLTVASHAVTNVGTFVAQIDGSALTALNLIDNLPNTLGSTTSGQSGVLGLGAVTTSAPSYTTAQSNALSLQTDGSLRTAITAALPAGTNAIGKLATNTGVTIGAVELVAAQTLATVTTVSTVTNLSQLGGVALPAEDAAETAGGVGIYSMSVRRDTAATSASTTGDNATINTDSLGRLWTTGSAVEDVAETAAGILNMAGTVRRDTAASSAGTTGDNATLNTDAVGALWVNPFSQTQAAGTYLATRLSDGTNFLTPGTDYTHDAALTASTTAGPMQVGRASAAAPTNVTAGDDAVIAWYLLNGSAVSNLAAGGTLITSTGASLNVNVTGGVAGGTQYAEDIAHTTADLVTMAGTVRQDTKGTGLGANGDVANLYVNASGELYTAPAGQVAHDAVATSVNPILVGGYASQAAPSDVSGDGDATRIWTLRNGSPVVNLAVGGTLLTATSTSLNVSNTNVGVEDVAETAAGSLFMSGTVRRDTAASSAGTTGDNATLNTDGNGKLWTNADWTALNGTAISTGNGSSGAGTMRVAIASDNTMPGTGTEDVAETAGGLLHMAGSVRRDVAATSAGATAENATLNTNAFGALWVSHVDPCSSETKTTIPISLTTDTVVIAAVASKKNYICSITIVAGAAEIVSITEGTGTVCGTGEAALAGSTTDANGMSFAANGGFQANPGNSTTIAGITANVDTCLNVSGSNRVSGYITYAQR